LKEKQPAMQPELLQRVLKELELKEHTFKQKYQASEGRGLSQDS